MASPHSRHTGTLWKQWGLWGVACCLLIILSVLWMPRFGAKSVNIEGKNAWITYDFPVNVNARQRGNAAEATITFPFSFRGLQMTSVILSGKGCVRKLLVNTIGVPLQQCELKHGILVSFPHDILSRNNAIKVTIEGVKHNDITLDIAPNRWTTLGFILLAGYAIMLFSGTMLFFRKSVEESRSIFFITLLGLSLRFLYTLHTPFNIRTYDEFGHIPYIEHFLRSFTLPSATEGWEMHQPPLYYFLSSYILRGSYWFTSSGAMRLVVLQNASLILSFITLGVMMMIGMHLLRGKKSAVQRMMYTILVMTLPGFIMFSSRISNDLPSLLFAVLGLFASILLWEKKHVRFWYVGLIVFALGFLAKLNAITGMPSLLLAFALLPTFSLRAKMKHGCAGILLFLVLTSWLPILRFNERPNDINRYVNIGTIGLDNGLKIAYKSPLQLFTLNPIAMLEIPFIQNRVDASRRGNFLEYFFRSAFFGEYSFFQARGLAPWILFCALCLLPWMIWGLIDVLRKEAKEQLPLLVTTASVFAAAIAYPVVWQFACNQDFRFSMILLVPISYFIARASAQGPLPLRWLCAIFVILLGVLSSIFIAAQ